MHLYGISTYSSGISHTLPPPHYCLSPISVLLFEQFHYSFRSTFSVVEIQNREQHEQQRRGHQICFAIRRPLQSLWCCEFRKPDECVGFSSGTPISIYFYFFSFPISSGSCQREEAQIVTIQVCVVMIVVRFLGSCSKTLGQRNWESGHDFGVQ